MDKGRTSGSPAVLTPKDKSAEALARVSKVFLSVRRLPTGGVGRTELSALTARANCLEGESDSRPLRTVSPLTPQSYSGKLQTPKPGRPGGRPGTAASLTPLRIAYRSRLPLRVAPGGRRGTVVGQRETPL